MQYIIMQNNIITVIYMLQLPSIMQMLSSSSKLNKVTASSLLVILLKNESCKGEHHIEAYVSDHYDTS